MGGGVKCINSDVIIENAMILGNSVVGDDAVGGGVSFFGGSDALNQIIANCLFIESP